MLTWESIVRRVTKNAATGHVINTDYRVNQTEDSWRLRALPKSQDTRTIFYYVPESAMKEAGGTHDAPVEQQKDEEAEAAYYLQICPRRNGGYIVRPKKMFLSEDPSIPT